YYNSVPFSQAEFQNKINEIVPEKLFKVLSNCQYFNEKLKWQERREILMGMAGEINNDMILAKDNTLQEIIDISVNQKKSFDELKKEYAAKKSKIKGELESIPSRIDEVQRATPEKPNMDEVQKAIGELTQELNQFEKDISSKNELSETMAQQISHRNLQKFKLQEKLTGIEFQIQAATNKAKSDSNILLAEKNSELTSVSMGLNNLKLSLSNTELKKQNVDKKVVQLRADFKAKNESQLIFKDDQFICPTCKRDFEGVDIEEEKEKALNNFNTEKTNALATLNTEGQSLVAQSKEFDTQIKSLNESIATETNRESELVKAISEAQPQIKSLNEQVAQNKEYAEIKEQIKAIDELPKPTKADISELLASKTEIIKKIDEQKAKSSIQSVIFANEKRIEELSKSQREMSQQLANLEKLEFDILKYVKLQTDIVTERVNGLFRFVKFKMFNIQVNGGIEPCCEALVNGVVYPDVNNAGKINAGLDVINTLSIFNDVFISVFVDNCESTNCMIPINSQLVRLVVSPPIPTESAEREKHISFYENLGVLLKK
ncbi:MAG: hypothetical protein WCI04_06155, partial [archaeon]